MDAGILDPFAPENIRDPFPVYRRIRESGRVLHRPDWDEYVLSHYDDIEGVLRDTRWSSNPVHLRARPNVSMEDFRVLFAESNARVLLFLDPPDHTRLRRLVSKAFTPRVVEQLRPRVQQLVDGLLDDVEASGSGQLEVIGQLAYPLPVIVICQLLGVPVEDRDQFQGWSSDASRLLDGDIDEATANRGIVAAMSFINYFNGLFEERRREPRDDLLSGLLAAEEEGDVLSEEELRSIVLLLFIAGHETTMNLIGNGLLALLRNRDQLDLLREDPTLAPSAVEELLRYDGPVHATARIATEDLEIAGVELEAGSQVICFLAAANRDPARFEDPDRLDIRRADNHHLTFSHGIHYCLGAALARVEGQVVLGTLARRYPHLALVTDEPEYRDHKVLRGLRELHVALHA
jgi:cytochrome P450